MADPVYNLIEFLASLTTLTQPESDRIGRARRDGRDPGNKAWNAAQAALVATGRESAWREATTAIGAMSLLPDPVRHGAYDAALAILARDVLTEPEFATLYAQWSAGGERQRAII